MFNFCTELGFSNFKISDSSFGKKKAQISYVFPFLWRDKNEIISNRFLTRDLRKYSHVHRPQISISRPQEKQNSGGFLLTSFRNFSRIMRKWLILNFMNIVCMHKFSFRYYSHVYTGYHNNMVTRSKKKYMHPMELKVIVQKYIKLNFRDF